MDFASQTVGTALRLPALIISLSCHEFAHAWTANRLGDDTAQKEGRLTLNPLAHLSLVGTLFIIFAPFGWAKPVPFHPLNFRSPLRDSGRVAFAGPLTNLFLSAVALCLFVLFFGTIPITKDVNFLNFVPQGSPALQLLAVFCGTWQSSTCRWLSSIFCQFLPWMVATYCNQYCPLSWRSMCLAAPPQGREQFFFWF